MSLMHIEHGDKGKPSVSYLPLCHDSISEASALAQGSDAMGNPLLPRPIQVICAFRLLMGIRREGEKAQRPDRAIRAGLSGKSRWGMRNSHNKPSQGSIVSQSS